MDDKSTDKNEILLNIMYAGSYIESDNIGHEIINLFKADNEKNYIYAMPYGVISHHHDNKIRCVLMVRRINANTLEILGKTVGKPDQILTEFTIKRNPSIEQQEAHKSQVEKIKQVSITYGGVSLNKIFEKNATNANDVYITFEADDVVKPKNRMYLTTDEALKGKENAGYFYLRDEDLSEDGSKLKFPKQSMKAYLSAENPKTERAFHLVNDIIENENLWGESVPKVADIPQKTPQLTFMKIIRKEYDELSYSNMLAFFFRHNRDVFREFAQTVLGVALSSNFTINREEAHIDLLIADDKNVIVIENKIKSDINGIKASGDSQLSDYRAYVENTYKSKEAKFFILSPNYTDLARGELKDYDKYNELKYGNIRDFYAKKKDAFKDIALFFKEFLAALEKQSQDTDNSLEEEMHSRFGRAIKQAKL